MQPNFPENYQIAALFRTLKLKKLTTFTVNFAFVSEYYVDVYKSIRALEHIPQTNVSLSKQSILINNDKESF